MAARRSDDRNPLALAVLAYLVERPMHPYELGKLLQERNAGASIKYRHASLYMVFEQLNRDGYIQPQETLRDGRRPERTIYRLTDTGRSELRAQMRRLVATPTKEYRRFEAALALIAVLPPAEVSELLGERQQALAGQAEQIRSHLKSSQAGDRLWLIEHEYRLGLIEAEQKFIEEFRTLIQEGGPEFGRFWRDLHSAELNEAPNGRPRED